MGEIEVLNRLCRDLYESVDPAARAEAERNLADFSESSECLRRCMLLLEQGILPYGPLVASNTLMKLLNSKAGILPDQKLEISRYLLQALGARASGLPPYIVSSLCQLFARITKQEWTYTVGVGEECSFPFREPIDSIIKTVSMNNLNESLLAVQVLSHLVSDMNSFAGFDTVNRHRKALAQFRDGVLYSVFQLSISLLEERVSTTNSPEQLQFLTCVLELCLNCLLFDFIGSMADETSEDNYNVQVPTAWRSAFVDGKIVTLIFQLYAQFPQPASEKILHIGVQLASIRRTLFNSSERQVFLEQLVKGVMAVIENPSKLNDQGAFHEFCRLISRLKINYQLCELIKITGYSEMMSLVARFTVQCLNELAFSANSTYYLLTFWHRMVTSVPYVRSGDEHLLNVYCPEIYSSFISSCLRNVDSVIRDGAEDPLDDQGSTIQLMEQLAVISRCDYTKTCELLCRLFDENIVSMQSSSQTDAKIAEGRLVWLVTLIGTAIFGKTTISVNEEHDKMDGDLVTRCLKFMRHSDNRLNSTPRHGNVRLEVAFVHMLEQFRRAYIMDQVTRGSVIYEVLQRELGISDESDMLSIIMQKILTNLKYWAMQGDILELSLLLLKDLSLGYTAVRKLFRLNEVQLLLSNHTAEHFPFLGSAVDFSTMKQRSVFYEALTRLLAIDLNDDEEVFQQFMSPITETVKGVCQVMSSNSGVDTERLKRVIVGLLRDVRGIAMACTTKALFQILFDWMYPDLFNIMQRTVEEWPDCADVTTPVFRLLAELCQNRQQRLKFEMSSCSAVLLFRETSKIIVAYGNRLLLLPEVSKESVYKQRFKNIGVIFSALKHTLMGAYVPFGVFRLYGDSCLQDSLDMFMKLFMRIPEDDFLSYTKISQNFYNLLESVVQDNIAFISNLEPEVFSAVLRAIHAGVCAIDAVVITSACSSLDILLGYLYKRFTRPTSTISKFGIEPEGDNCIIAVKGRPELLSQLLHAMLTALMLGEVKCQWSMSRPLLGLILLQEDVFTNFKQEVINQQAPERRDAFRQTFDCVMEGVERNLSVKNKDTFTQNLSKFRRDIVEIMKGKELTTANNNEMD